MLFDNYVSKYFILFGAIVNGIVLFSFIMFTVHKNAIGLVYCELINFIYFFGIFYIDNHAMQIEEVWFYPSNVCDFCPFCLPYYNAGNFSTVMNKILFPVLKEKHCLSLFSMKLAINSFRYYQLEKVHL